MFHYVGLFFFPALIFFTSNLKVKLYYKPRTKISLAFDHIDAHVDGYFEFIYAATLPISRLIHIFIILHSTARSE